MQRYSVHSQNLIAYDGTKDLTRGERVVVEAVEIDHVVREALHGVAGRCQQRMSGGGMLSYDDVADACREVATEHGVYIYL